MARSVRRARLPEVVPVTELAQPPGAPAGAGRRPRFGPRHTWTRVEKRNLRTGLLFISPWLVGFLAFNLYPALASLYYSFTDFKIRLEPR